MRTKKKKLNRYAEAVLSLNDILIVIGENMQQSAYMPQILKLMFLDELKTTLQTALNFVDQALEAENKRI